MKREGVLLVIAVLVPMVLQGLALFNPDMATLDCEERYNAGHAMMLVEGHADAWLRLQYRNFCGGCSFTALVGAAVMGVFGTSWLAWKGVALLFTGVLSGVGAVTLERRVGRMAAVFWVLLICFSPLNWIRLSLLSWGNHLEAGVLAVCIVAMLLKDGGWRWQLGTGALCGAAIWFGFSSVFAVTGALGLRMLQGRWKDVRWMGLGIGLAPLLWLLQWWNTGLLPFGTIYQEGEAIPSVSRLPAKAWTLIAPQQLVGLWGVPEVSIGLPLAIGWAFSLLAAVGATVWMIRRSMVNRSVSEATLPVLIAAGLLLIWSCIYLVVGFGLQLEPWPIVAAPPGLRYFAPVYPIVFLWLAAIAGCWWKDGGRKRALVLLIGPLLSGLVARAATVSAPFPVDFARQLQASDLPYFRLQASYVLTPEEHGQCTADSDDSRALHAYSLGRRAQLDLLGEIPRDGVPPDTSLAELSDPDPWPSLPWYEGVGGGLVDNLDGSGEGSMSVLQRVHERLYVLPEEGFRYALDEALWRRVYRSSDWSLGRGEVTENRLQQVLRLLEEYPESFRDAWLRAYGRRWGRVHARLAQPGVIRFPDLPVWASDSFTRGLGQGLGAEWGPQERIPAPAGLDAELDEILIEGYATGLGRQWRRTDEPTVVRDSDWVDVEADRWWGRAPPMLCPCNSTCE